MSKYINADRLKVTLLNFADRTKDMEDVGIGIGVHSCIHCLDEMPSADVVEVKQGEWEINTTIYKCKNCGCFFDISQATGEMNFCPNCGADMRGEENEN